MKYAKSVIILSIFFLFSTQVNQSNAEFHQVPVESSFDYIVENMHFTEQYNKTYRSCSDVFLPLSETELKNVNMTIKQDVQSDTEFLPEYLDLHPDNRNITLNLISSSINNSGFTYTDQWVGFLDSMNKSIGKKLFTSLSKEDFLRNSCILPKISSLIFPRLQTMTILPIIASGNINYYNDLLKEYPFENSPAFITESTLKNISNQDIIEMSFRTNFFKQITSGTEVIDFWYWSNLNVEISLNTKTVINFNFVIHEIYEWEGVSREFIIYVEFKDNFFYDFYYLFGFKSNLATLFLIAVLTIYIRKKQKNKQIW